MNGMTKEQQDLVNKIFSLVDRVMTAIEVNAETRRAEFQAADVPYVQAEVESLAAQLAAMSETSDPAHYGEK